MSPSIRAARLQRRVWRGGPPIRRPVQPEEGLAQVRVKERDNHVS